MIAVEDAISQVLKQSIALEAERVPLLESVHRTLAEDVIAADALPPFDASIMDGYAVCANDSEGEYQVVGRITAGCDPMAEKIIVSPGKVAYITTGAKMPEGADAVIKVESTEAGQQDADGNELTVRIKQGTTAGKNIRPAGVDIRAGQLVLQAGDIITPAEIGLLATVGVSEVLVSPKPVVGVMSTGDELVDPTESSLVGGKIRDSNRYMLMSLLEELGATVEDLGIIHDQVSDLESGLAAGLEKCDVVVTSGGVSMGEADLLKGLLTSMGTIHFGRLSMKPGKPTTFATVESGGRKKLVFALPGNPVSCMVTTHLLVNPALKRLRGCAVEDCMPAQVDVQLASTIKLDPERPEYHRAKIYWDSNQKAFLAESTGSQLSSRLLSMKSANALLCIPQGTGILGPGTHVAALMIGDLPPPDPENCFHRKAALSFADTSPIKKPRQSDYVSFSSIQSESELKNPQGSATTTEEWKVECDCGESHGSHAHGHEESQAPHPPLNAKRPRPHLRAGLLIVSDRAAAGTYPDKSGPVMEAMVTEANNPFTCEVVERAIVPDESGMIQEKIKYWADDLKVDFIITSGGTGFSQRDITPESVRPLLHREAPGLVFAIMQAGTKHTPLAVLSRPVAGTRNKSLIFTVPGSSKAVKEDLEAMIPLIPRVCNLLSGKNC
eukprot:CAMPEP_0117748530 /NCGR_PEP_ID=MMETSP0947-20121206/9190_1 /TAXON_ID=44440 /ORGANISM="Chattonella subsalsa, Strain CCMP2191" /LENGTH=667 /DNA_ID=CAMNT_0005566249 /DNA_START=111 /DNA_END=2114 /DNA_ORIENTATION=+